jgi:metal-dependent hydrolase (beta-lactamase superfamily II)
VLLDAGEGRAAYVDNVRAAIQHLSCTALCAIIVSHWHHDHLDGVPSVQASLGRPAPVLKVVLVEAPRAGATAGATTEEMRSMA